MAIEELQCHEFRNLKNTTLTFNPQLNIIIGDNGSGKSSLLESIYTLTTSKSFRTKYLKNCIQHSHSKFTLFGKYSNHSVGIQKGSSQLLTKVNNKIITKRSDLAKLQSILSVDSNSFDLINGSKQKRREYMNWALFHVKQSFSDIWVQYKNILKQRNQLLRSKNIKEINYWDKYLIKFNNEINIYRKELIDKLKVRFYETYGNNEILNQIEIVYVQGWKNNISFEEALSERLTYDLKRGFTSVGAHKSDIIFSINNKDIKEVFSRGQLKNLVISLYIVLMDYVNENSSSRPIFIIDDLMAELDKNTIKDVIVSLLNKNYQIFISNIEHNSFLEELTINKTMFHVKHGEINTPNK